MPQGHSCGEELESLRCDNPCTGHFVELSPVHELAGSLQQSWGSKRVHALTFLLGSCQTLNVDHSNSFPSDPSAVF